MAAVDAEGLESLLRPQVYVVKPGNEGVTSSIALQDDDHLLFAIGANEQWVFEFFIIWRSSAAADITFSITVPSGSGDFNVGRQAGTASAEPIYTSTGLGGPIDVHADAFARRATHIFGVANNGATPGNVVLQWAQRVSDGTTTFIFANSWLRATRVS